MSTLSNIKGAEFAQRSEQLSGEVRVAAMSRITDLLASPDGVAKYSLSGFLSKDGKPAIRLRVRATLHMTCQRCLEAMPVDVESTRDLVFVATHHLGEFDEEDEDSDYLPIDEAVSPDALVEDELILAMPIAPRHADGACAGHASYKTDSAGDRDLDD